MTVTVVDESPSGERLNTLTLEDLDEEVTARELIRARIYQEVSDYNARQPSEFKGLVAPTAMEKRLNGPRSTTVKPIDWEAQFKAACKAFETNGFFMLVDDRQVGGLDEVFTVTVESEVSFVKLVPLVGG